MPVETAQHEQIKILYLDGNTWRQLPGTAELLAGYQPQRGEDPGRTGARIVTDIVTHMRTSPITELGAQWRNLLAGRSWRVEVYAGHLRDFPELYWSSLPTQAVRHEIRDERWTTSKVAERLGIGRTEVGRTLDRWGVAPVGREPGRTGENLYDPQAVCLAITNRPRRGRGMTFSDLLATLFSGESFTADQSAHVTRWLAAERDRKQAIRDQVAGMTDVYRLGEPSTMTHFDGRPVFPGHQVLVGSGPVGYVEQVGDGWRGTYEESYVGATRCTVRATKDEAAVDVVAELVFRKLPSQ